MAPGCHWLALVRRASREKGLQTLGAVCNNWLTAGAGLAYHAELVFSLRATDELSPASLKRGRRIEAGAADASVFSFRRYLRQCNGDNLDDAAVNCRDDKSGRTVPWQTVVPQP